MELTHAIVGLSIGLCAAAATATPLNLVLQDTPDILSGFIDVEYDSDDDLLTARGFALTIDFPDALRGDAVPITNGFFSIDADIDEDGDAMNGTLLIIGDVQEGGASSPALLEGNLIAFGFPDSPVSRGGDLGVLEFLFEVTGGTLAPLFGTQAGVILANNGFAGFWDGNWDNLDDGEPGTGIGVSDTAPPVPAPAGALALAAAAGIVSLRRRR